jgi:phage tail-like protein
MLELARVTPSDVVYDLGSGDGRTVITAAQQFGAEAVGVELDDGRFEESAARIAALGLGRRAKIMHGDLFAADLHRATVVTLYLLSRVNARLRLSLEAQLRPGTRVVAHDFPVPGWEPARVVTSRLGVTAPHALYLYVIQQPKEKPMPTSSEKLQRGYAAGRVGMMLEGAMAGWLNASEGGNASADVMVEKLGPDRLMRKHLAGVKYEDITVQCGLGMSQSFYDWLAATVSQKYARKNGELLATDFHGQVVSRLGFYNALISEIGLPALDASSKDAAKLTLKIRPEYTRRQSGGGATVSQSQAAGQKSWLASNFRLAIDGLDCTRVNRIEALTLRQHIVENAVGELRDYQQEPSYLEVPNLVVTLAAAHAEDFYDWLEDFVIKGNNTEDKEKNGSLEYLSPNLGTVLFSLTFRHLGIFKLSEEKAEAGSEAVRRVRAEMYCEEIVFSPPAGTVAGAAEGKGASGSQASSASQPAAEGQAGSARLVASELDVAAFKQAALKELLKETALTLQPSPQAAETARKGPPLRFRS